MGTVKTIEHTGIIKEILEDTVVVSILQNSGCASCLSKESCNLSETKEKEIEIKKTPIHYLKGERVDVFFAQSLGYKALLLGYVIPFLLILFLLIALSTQGIEEGIIGLITLGSLIPYFIVLYLFRDKLKKTFEFSIRKQNA